MKAHHISGPPALIVYGGVRLPQGTVEYDEWAKKIGEGAWKRGWVVRTGGGPGAAMEGVPRAYINARTADNAPRDEWNATQGLSIGIGREPINPFIEKEYAFKHFFPRKTGFHENALAEIAVPGGYGTWDEIFEALRR